MLFTQYLMPDGEKRQQTIDRPEDIEILAREVIDAGGCFESEMLSVAEGSPNVSLTCAYADDDIAIRVVLNGPEVLEAIDELVKEAHTFIAIKEEIL